MKSVITAVLSLALVAGAVAAFAGASGGPRSASYNLDAGGAVDYKIAFNANETAIVGARSDPRGTDIDIYVYDSNGRLVDSDTETDDTPVCIWHPSSNQVYTIRVKNASNSSTSFTMKTN